MSLYLTHQSITGPFSSLSVKLPVLFEILISGAKDGAIVEGGVGVFCDAVIGTTEFVSGTLVVVDVALFDAGWFTALLFDVVVTTVVFIGGTFCSISVDSVDTTEGKIWKCT